MNKAAKIYKPHIIIIIVKITKKLVAVGQSVGLIINKYILDKLNLIRGDWVEIEIKKVNNHAD